LSALERRARLLSESLEEATDSVLAHRSLLEATPSILPTEGWLSSRFSQARMHPVHNRPLPHEGVDIAATRGTPILAAAKGKVVYAANMSGYGMMVEIDHGYGYTTRYGHASRLLVRVGQSVQRGERIALVGKTGIATSSHLHYEVRVAGTRVDVTPREFEILRVLLTHAGGVVTKGRLLRAVWGVAYQGEDSYVYVHVSQLRRKLATADPALRELIVTEPGVGYRISEPLPSGP